MGTKGGVDVTLQEQELESYMQQYGDEILRLCYTYVHNWQTAEDLTQDTFMKLYTYADAFRGDASIKTYIYRIAINVCNSYLASWKFKKVVISNSFHKLLKAKDEVAHLVVENEEAYELVKAIERLAPKYKDVLLLFYYADMSIAEISKVLNMPVNTVKTRLSRARGLLKNVLQEGEHHHAID